MTLALAFLAAQVADALTFVRMVDAVGLAAERNPVVASMGVGLALAAKGLLILAVLAVAAVVRTGRYRGAGDLLLLAGVVVGAFGAGANTGAVG